MNRSILISAVFAFALTACATGGGEGRGAEQGGGEAGSKQGSSVRKATSTANVTVQVINAGSTDYIVVDTEPTVIQQSANNQITWTIATAGYTFPYDPANDIYGIEFLKPPRLPKLNCIPDPTNPTIKYVCTYKGGGKAQKYSYIISITNDGGKTILTSDPTVMNN
jgi:hypothetical protein